MMKILNAFPDQTRELEQILKLKTQPIAIKLLEKEDEISGEAIRPKRDLGQHMALCVAFSKTRREGKTIAMLKEDMWCFSPVLGLGLEKPPKYYLEGHHRFPDNARTLDAGKYWAGTFPRFQYGRYIGIMSAPLKATSFEPDLVLVYCDTAQLTHLLISANWNDGHDVISRMSGMSACVYATVPATLDAAYQVTPPCDGDRKHAMAQDNEVIFTIPKGKTADLLEGLQYLVEHSNILSRNLTVELEYNLPEQYEKIGKMIGMDIK